MAQSSSPILAASISLIYHQLQPQDGGAGGLQAEIGRHLQDGKQAGEGGCGSAVILFHSHSLQLIHYQPFIRKRSLDLNCSLLFDYLNIHHTYYDIH